MWSEVEVVLAKDPFNAVFVEHEGLSSNIKHLVLERDADALHRMNGQMSSFFDRVYENINHSTGTGKRSRLAWLAIIPVLLICVAFYSPLKEKYREEKNYLDLVRNEEKYKEQTLADILALKSALQAYHNDNNSYPKSSGGMDGVVSAFGESKKDWIPGLAPKYIKVLPVDPRQHRTPMEQYLYKSDGKDFKLVAHFPLGMSEIIEKHPELVDPIRPSWAFGVWSDSAKSW